MLLEFGGTYYCIDFDSLDKFLFVKDDKKVIEIEIREIFGDIEQPNKVTGSEKITKEFINEKEINGIRYELQMDLHIHFGLCLA